LAVFHVNIIVSWPCSELNIISAPLAGVKNTGGTGFDEMTTFVSSFLQEKKPIRVTTNTKYIICLFFIVGIF
jgi:hypothetical protein